MRDASAAERLVRRVDDVPAPLDLAFADRVGLRAHRSSVVSVVVHVRPAAVRGRRAGGRARGPGRGPVAGRCPGGDRRRGHPLRHLSLAGLDEDGHHAPDHARGGRRRPGRRSSRATRLPTRTAWTVRTGVRSRRPEGPKSCRPTKACPARSIAAISSGARTPSAQRSRSGLRGPFQTV